MPAASRLFGALAGHALVWIERESGNGEESSKNGSGEDHEEGSGNLKADSGGRTPSSVSHVSLLSPWTLGFGLVTYCKQIEYKSAISVNGKRSDSFAPPSHTCASDSRD